MASGNKNSKKPGPGRPPGSPNRDYDKSTTVADRCKKCDSTEICQKNLRCRRKYNGIAADGKPYNEVAFYAVKCAKPGCGQWRNVAEHRMVLESEQTPEKDPPPGDPLAADLVNTEIEDNTEGEGEVDNLSALAEEGDETL